MPLFSHLHQDRYCKCDTNVDAGTLRKLESGHKVVFDGMRLEIDPKCEMKCRFLLNKKGKEMGHAGRCCTNLTLSPRLSNSGLRFLELSKR